MRDEPTMRCGPPKMPLSLMDAATKTEAAASLSRGLAAAFVFMVAGVLSVCEALQLRTTPVSTANAVEAGNITTTSMACCFRCRSRI